MKAPSPLPGSVELLSACGDLIFPLTHLTGLADLQVCAEYLWSDKEVKTKHEKEESCSFWTEPIESMLPMKYGFRPSTLLLLTVFQEENVFLPPLLTCMM